MCSITTVMEAEVEPVRHVDVRLLAPQDRAAEGDEVGDPDHGQPQVHVPLGLGVLLALRDAEDVAERRHDDEELVAPEQEPAHVVAAEQPGPAGPLDDVEGGAEQRVAAEREDDSAGVHGPQPPEGGPFEVEVEQREGELRRDHHAH
jgi:23S rRNA (cytosine1962-C5)-methyltransferase